MHPDSHREEGGSMIEQMFAIFVLEMVVCGVIIIPCILVLAILAIIRGML